jgi:hypothetical protein
LSVIFPHFAWKSGKSRPPGDRLDRSLEYTGERPYRLVAGILALCFCASSNTATGAYDLSELHRVDRAGPIFGNSNWDFADALTTADRHSFFNYLARTHMVRVPGKGRFELRLPDRQPYCSSGRLLDLWASPGRATISSAAS